MPNGLLPRSACQTDELLRNPPAGSPAGSKPYNRHKYAFDNKVKNKPPRPSTRPRKPLNLPFQPVNPHHTDALAVAPSGSYLNWKVLKADSEALAEGDDSEKRLLPLLKVFHVFNLDQVDGLPNEYRAAPDTGTAWEPSEIAERIIECSGAEIRHGGFRAFYSPPNDLIYLPLRSSFRDQASYYSTALHELCHWTGHASRLGRKLGKRFGESAYAMEELIAEMGAAFLAAHCRLEVQVQHANYIASWLEVLKRDKRAVFTASAQAQKAADYLLEHAGLITPADAMPLAA
jgi:antirestriction protein ArdC